MSGTNFEQEVAALVADYTRRLTDLTEENEAGQQALFDELAARVADGDPVATAAMVQFANGIRPAPET